jgi:hypothetical protein
MNIVKLAEKIISHQIFQNAVVYAIILCSIVLGIETYYPPNVKLFLTADIIFSIFFIIEIILRMLASGNLFKFFSLFRISKKENGKYKITADEKY